MTSTEPEMYTLAEARKLVERQQLAEACQSQRHRPSIELAELGQRASTWLCDCGQFTYAPEDRTA